MFARLARGESAQAHGGGQRIDLLLEGQAGLQVAAGRLVVVVQFPQLEMGLGLGRRAPRGLSGLQGRGQELHDLVAALLT